VDLSMLTPVTGMLLDAGGQPARQRAISTAAAQMTMM
jgi:hypothetical protein